MASKEETDTVVTWTLADEFATVYSMLPRIWRQCERAGGTEIRLDEGIRDGKKVARTFLVDPRLVAIRRRRTLSESQREAISLRARSTGFRKQAKPPIPDGGEPA